MLHIQSTFHIPSPHLHAGGQHHLVLSPVIEDNDELLQSIRQEREADAWTLDSPDASQLDTFWKGVTEDLVNDPEWFKFSND